MVVWCEEVGIRYTNGLSTETNTNTNINTNFSLALPILFALDLWLIPTWWMNISRNYIIWQKIYFTKWYRIAFYSLFCFNVIKYKYLAGWYIKQLPYSHSPLLCWWFLFKLFISSLKRKRNTNTQTGRFRIIKPDIGNFSLNLFRLFPFRNLFSFLNWIIFMK